MLGYDTYLWQRLYTSDSFKVTLKEGMIKRGFFVTGSAFSWRIMPPYMSFSKASPTVALDFNIASGDLSDNLVLYAYAPSATAVDLDIWNSLKFGFFTADIFVKEIVSTATASPTQLPQFGVKATVDLGKALGVEGTSLIGYGAFSVNPGSSDINTMLQDYVFGVDFSYGKISGSVAFEKENKLGLALKTTALDPITLGGDVVLNVTNPTGDFSLAGYASWKFELFSNTAYVTYKALDKSVTAGWTIGVRF
ncbi:hypothetical protein [Pseudothermotoga sp.]|uniref:hypothetical protein n=1 Tax=Pseudothermotoga sp. TaxID=2033661 RepID=UPI0031F6ACA0